jgi:hypothetical protein
MNEEMPKRGRGRPPKNALPVMTEAPKLRFLTKRNWPIRKIIISAVLIFIVLGISFFFYNQGKKSTDQADADKKLIAKVAKHALLPTDEQPVVYRITDPEKLKGQSFFNGAQRDDVVLAYSKSSKAVIYRPSVDRIIVAVLLPVNTATPQ